VVFVKCLEPDSATRFHPGNQHSGKYIFERIQPSRGLANHVHHPIRHGPISTVPHRIISTTRECMPGNTFRAPTCRSIPTTWDLPSAGPVIPHHHHLFFYFAVEPLRSSRSTNGSVTFADPQFTSFAQTNYPNTVGTHLLTHLPSRQCDRRERSRKPPADLAAAPAAAALPRTEWSALRPPHDRFRLVRATQIRNGKVGFLG